MNQGYRVVALILYKLQKRLAGVGSYGVYLGNSLRAIHHIELLEYALEVILHSKGTDVQDHADFLICFTGADPFHDVELTSAELVVGARIVQW